MDQIKTAYVLGFLFSNDMKRVALIQKERPNWQKGRLNGIGGHIEENEMAIDAMSREFFEETGVKVSIYDWKKFCEMEGSGFLVKCFAARVKEEGPDPELEKKTDELPGWYSFDFLHYSAPNQIIPNLKWLIPMAMEEDVIDVSVKYCELKGDS